MDRNLTMIILIALAVGLSSCYYDNEQDLYPSRFCDVGNVASADFYAVKVEPIITSRCAISGCHVAGPNTAPGDYNNYMEVKAVVDNGKFQTFVLVDKSMPLNSTLPSCDLETLQAWVGAGAPN